MASISTTSKRPTASSQVEQRKQSEQKSRDIHTKVSLFLLLVAFVWQPFGSLNGWWLMELTSLVYLQSSIDILQEDRIEMGNIQYDSE